MMADKDTVIPLLKTAKGHIEGIIRMMEDNRYCIDISNIVFTETFSTALFNSKTFVSWLLISLFLNIEAFSLTLPSKKLVIIILYPLT